MTRSSNADLIISTLPPQLNEPENYLTLLNSLVEGWRRVILVREQGLDPDKLLNFTAHAPLQSVQSEFHGGTPGTPTPVNSVTAASS